MRWKKTVFAGEGSRNRKVRYRRDVAGHVKLRKEHLSIVICRKAIEAGGGSSSLEIT